jgi:hypothetical protein
MCRSLRPPSQDGKRGSFRALTALLAILRRQMHRQEVESPPYGGARFPTLAATASCLRVRHA